MSFGSIPPGSNFIVTWTVSRATGTPSEYLLPPSVVASFHIDGQPASTQASVPIIIPIIPNDAHNNVGISNSSTAGGNFDGQKDSYAAQTLEAAGLSPGSKFLAVGLNFVLPDMPTGQPNNILAISQTVQLS